MYLIFSNAAEKQQLKDFKQTQSYICFAFENEVAEETFTGVEKFKMYSDDDMFLTEYTLDDYKLICNGNELYLKDKNEVIDLETAKADKIAMSKQLLAEWLAEHPYLYSDGKYYACTEEKQALLNGNLASYERAKAVGIDYPLKWNSTNCPCESWDYNNLLALSLAIAAYVAPKVSQQQTIEIQIRECNTIEDINNIEINYDK